MNTSSGRKGRPLGNMRPTGDDPAHIQVLEAVLIALIMIGAVGFVISFSLPTTPNEPVLDALDTRADDALSVLNELPVDDTRYGNNLLSYAIAQALQGDSTELETRLKGILPPATKFNVYLYNGDESYLIYYSGEPRGERVTATQIFEPAWSHTFVSRDSRTYSAPNTMGVYALPVFNSNVVDDGGVPIEVVAEFSREGHTWETRSFYSTVQGARDVNGDRVGSVVYGSDASGDAKPFYQRIDPVTGLHTGEKLVYVTVEESEGGVVITTGESTPFLIRKSDGTTLYGTRDIVAAIDRFERYGFDRMLYVVDVAQEQHFRQLFASLRRLGWPWADRCEHVAFGQVLVGGSRAKTREGESVELIEVLREGEKRALAVVEEKNAALKDKEAVARAVGTAAVIFCDVGFPIRKNIHFDWNEILSFDGRTGPYLQYVHASACSILRKGGGTPGSFDAARLSHDLEWDLVRRLAEFPAALKRAAAECEPSHVSGLLYDLAREFRSYHTAGARDATLRVLVDDAATRAARLKLTDSVRATLAVGLRLLGIEPLEEM